MRRISIILITILLVLLLSIGSTLASKVTLEWQPNTEENLAGYKIFYKLEGNNYDYANPAWQGSEITCTLTIPDDGKKYYFIARAFDTEGLESENSNEVNYTTPLGLGVLSGNITYTDPNSTTFSGIINLGDSGRSVSFDWPDIPGAEGYQVRFNLIQTNTISTIGNTPTSNISIMIPQTGLFAFQVRGGKNIGQAGEEWTPWYSSDKDNIFLVNGTPLKVLFSGWPAAVGPIVVE